MIGDYYIPYRARTKRELSIKELRDYLLSITNPVCDYGLLSCNSKDPKKSCLDGAAFYRNKDKVLMLIKKRDITKLKRRLKWL